MSKIELLHQQSARVRAQIAAALRLHKYERADNGQIRIAGSGLQMGGALQVRDYRDMSLEVAAIDDNTLTTQGLVHAANNIIVPTGGYSQVTQWYVTPFSGNHTPDEDVTAATFNAAATEFTAYTSATRLALVVAEAATTPATGNTGNEALMVCNSGGPYNVYGAYLLSVATKGSGSGKSLAGIRLENPKLGMAGGDKLGFEYVLTLGNAA